MVAIGDALGMPAHDMTAGQIRERFNGPLRSFKAPLEDSRVHAGMCAGQVTDDTLLTLAVAKAYIDHQGQITPRIIADYSAETVRKATAQGLGTMFGPSTRKSIELIDEGRDPVEAFLKEKHPMAGASNGGAMKVSPAGLIHPGDINGAVNDALMVCLPSHATQTAISAACAVAAGVSEAMTSQATVFSVVKAALAGAEIGEQVGAKKARVVPLPSVHDRIRLAVSLALQSGTVHEACKHLSHILGTGLAAYESIPTAIGIFVAAAGNPAKCVVAGANIGNDTDTIASITGALAGALQGFDGIPKRLFYEVERVNRLGLRDVARGLREIARSNGR